jgi:tetratricopeptide (TPR) repeat protein
MAIPDPPLELPDLDIPDTPFKRRTALAVAVLAFVGGLLGVGAGLAADRADAQGRDAQRAAVAAMADRSTAYAQFYDVLGGHTEVRGVQQRLEMARFRASLAPRGDDAAAAAEWEQAAGALQDLSLDLAGVPYSDQLTRYGSDLLLDPAIEQLRADAAAETAGSWGNKADRYVFGITLLAVALPLLGLSLTVSPSARRPLVWAAALIAAGAVGVGAQTAVMPVVTTPDAAIRAVADGDRLAALHRFDDAVDAYTRALRARSDYTIAFRQRAGARIAAASPEKDTLVYTVAVTSPEARRLAVEDLYRAMDADAPDYTVLLNQGANLFHLRAYAEGERLTRQALALNDELPLPWSNLGLFRAAQGDADGARRAYDALVARIRQRPDAREQGEIYAVSRTTLEMLAAMEPDKAGLALELEGRLVAAQSGTDADRSAGSSPRIAGLRLSSAGFQLVATYSHTGVPADAVLSWIPYTRQRPDQPWQQRWDLTRFGRFGVAENGSSTTTLLDTLCPARGEQYRVDVWLGNDRLATATTGASSASGETSYVAAYDPAGPFSTCRPEGWDIDEEVPGLLSLTEASGDARFVVRAVPVPAEVSADPDAAVAAALDAQVAALSPSHTGQIERTGPWNVGGLAGTSRQYARGTDGALVWAWAGMAQDGVIRIVAARYGEKDVAVVNDMTERVQFGFR